MMKKVKSLFLVLLCVFFITACMMLPDRQQVCQAADHRNNLQVLVHKLDTVTFEPSYSELERDQIRLNYARKISEIVERMVKRQQHQDKHSCRLTLSDPQQKIFNQLSSQLQQQALYLVELIKLQRTELIKAQIHNINQICQECHQQLNIQVRDRESEK